MKKTLLVVMALLSGAMASNAALAWGHHHGHVRFGLVIGAPLWPAYYPYYPAYYPPYYYPPVVVQSSPPVYVERPAEPAAPQASPAPQGYWYYCEQSRGYYPYVKNCPGGWQAVPPAPAPAPG